jgi:hypothetical protein
MEGLTFPPDRFIAAAMFRPTSDPAQGGSDAAPAVETDISTVLGTIDTCSGYAGLIAIMQGRFDQLVEAGDRRARGLTPDHMRRFGPVTLGPILGVLGIKFGDAASAFTSSGHSV